MTIELANSSTRVETMWCTDCGARLTDDETKGCWGCPQCGSQGIPCGVDQDVRVEINWHELHILCVWAENYAQRAGGMPLTVVAIARRLQRQFPEFGPLTLSEEIAELPAALDRAGIQHGGIESNVPKPRPIAVNGPGAVGHSAPTMPMTDEQIKHMVDRFLGWRLPENFSPDGGVSFKKTFNEHTAHPMKHQPSGTNLLDATQTDAMVRYLIEGLPASRPAANI